MNGPPTATKVPHVFVSHGKADAWVAGQIALAIRVEGASTFLDETDIAKGDNFMSRIHEEVSRCSELVALFTPWSSQRTWVWVEIGAAWGQKKRVVAVLYGVTVSDLEATGGKAILENINIVEINALDNYLHELGKRVKGLNGG